jgi:hypothetical protein
MSLKSRCCENPCDIKTCRGCDTCSQAHFEQHHAAALYHLELAHRALEQLDTGMLGSETLKKISNAVKGGVAAVKDRVQQLKIAYNKHQLESLKHDLDQTIDPKEKEKIQTKINELQKQIKQQEEPTATPPAASITQTAQMRTNPYCLG